MTRNAPLCPCVKRPETRLLRSQEQLNTKPQRVVLFTNNNHLLNDNNYPQKTGLTTVIYPKQTVKQLILMFF